jgi:TetR/AcrR family transcriptional regulator
MTSNPKTNRKEQILQCLASMLETNPGQKITTAKLAAEVGVSEAALYRHFPSKARMFEGLIGFVDDSVMGNINLIMEKEKAAITRCHHIMNLILVFAERNPGICRILCGDALMGEQERLRTQTIQLFERIETQLKQVLREAKLREGKTFKLEEGLLANMLLAFVDGKISQFVRSDFKRPPSEGFKQQWEMIEKQLLN